MARSVFRPIIFALKRAPTWPGIIVPYSPPEEVWALSTGVWRNTGYWFSEEASWAASPTESDAEIYDGMPESEVIGTIRYLIDLWDGTGSANTASPQAATIKLNDIAYRSEVAQITDRMAGSDAMDIINRLLSISITRWLAALSPSAIAGWDLRTNFTANLDTAFARATEAYMLGSGSDMQQFGVDTLARIDSVGGQFERERIRVSKYPISLGDSNWISSSGTTFSVLSAEGYFTAPCRIISGGSTASRRQSPEFAMAAEEQYRVKARYRVGTSPNFRLIVRSNSAALQSTISGTVGNLASTEESIGEWSNVVNDSRGGGLYEVSATFTPFQTLSDFRIGPGPGSSTAGQYVDALGVEVVQGDGPSSWILGDVSSTYTKAADILGIAPYTSDTYDLRAILLNNAVEVVAGSATGNITLDPGSLTIPQVQAFYLTDVGADIDPPTTAGYYPILDATGKSPARTSWLNRTLGIHTGAVSYPNLPYSLQFSSLRNKARLELHDTIFDRRPNDPEVKRRAEIFWSTISGNAPIDYGVEYWQAFQFNFATPTDPVGLGSDNVVIDQVPDPDLPGSPILSTRYVAGNLRILTRAATDSNAGTVRYNQPIATDRVHDIVRRVTLGASGNLQVWLDGVEILNLTGIPIGTAPSGASKCYSKAGLYCATGMAGVLACQFANYAYWTTDSLFSRVSSPPQWPND